MRRIIGWTLAALALLVPGAARAQLELGARVGYAAAAGDLAQHASLSDTFGGQIPFQADVLWRIRERFAVGAYGGWGIARVSSAACPLEADCSGSVWRFGVEGAWTLPPLSERIVPWVGAGLGWESASHTLRIAGTRTTYGYRGIELLDLQGGGAFRVNASFSVGPYAQLSIGRYSHASIDAEGFGSDGGAIAHAATHAWIGLGVRGSYGF